jgi:plastocyanin
MFRRASLAAFVLMVLSTSSVLAATKTVTVYNKAFKPGTVTITVGDSVSFKNITLKTHSPTPTNNYSWGGVSVGPGQSVVVTPTQTGSYPYFCALHPLRHKGTVAVKMGVSPTAGTTATMFTLTLGTMTAPGVLVHQVYARVNGGAWVLRATTNAPTHSLLLTTAGTWELQTRMKYVLGGATSAYSPISTVMVF